MPQGGNGGTGSTNKVIYDDSSGNLYSYVSGQLTSIFGSTPGTLNGVGTGADIIDGGAGNDHLFGLGGNDIFVFEITDAGASDVDVIWDFNRLGEGDKIRLTNNNNITINNYGYENREYITDKLLTWLVQRPSIAVRQLIEKMHFNLDHPENHNLKSTNQKSKYVEI